MGIAQTSKALVKGKGVEMTNEDETGDKTVSGNLVTYKVRYTLLEPMLGTVPKNKDIYTDYLADKALKNQTPQIVSDQTVDDLITEEVETVPESTERGYTGFHTDYNGIFVYDYLIKGHLKEAGNVLKDILKVKNLRSKLDSYLFVRPRRVYLKAAPDGSIERPIRAMTAQGPRVSLIKSDYVDAGLTFEVSIVVLHHSEINRKLLEQLLEYGQLQGLGQFRNGSYGRFEAEILS